MAPGSAGDVDDVPQYRGAYEYQFGASCGVSGAGAGSPTGQLELTTVTSTLVEGSYVFDEGAGVLDGSFSVPIMDREAPAGTTACCVPPPAE